MAEKCDVPFVVLHKVILTFELVFLSLKCETTLIEATELLTLLFRCMCFNLLENGI